MTTDDGKALRLDSRASLDLPLNFVGLDTYAVGLLLFYGLAL